MTRLFDRITLLTRNGFIFVAALGFVSYTAFAQDSGEQPTPEAEPILEGDDDIVITEDVVEVIETTDSTEEIVLEEEEVLSEEELAAIAAAEMQSWEQELGQRTLDAAKAAAAAGRWRDAANKYSEASKYLPNNPEIIRGLQHAYSMLDQSQLLNEYQQQLQMAREEAREMFKNAIASANNKLMREEFAAAQQIIAGAISRLDREDRRLFSEDEYIQKRTEANALNAQIALLQEAWQQQRLVEQAEERATDQAMRQAEESRKRAQMIDDSMKRIRQLQAERKYGEAVEIVDEILFIDQHNTAALALREALVHQQLYLEYGRAGRAKETGFTELGVQNREAMVPLTENMTGPGERSTTGIMGYPSEWEQLTRRRLDSTSGFSDTFQNRTIRVAMDQTTGSSHDIDGRTLGDVLAEIEAESGLPDSFFIDWARINAMDTDPTVDKDFEITKLKMGNVSLLTLLERVLNYVNIQTHLDSDDVLTESPRELIWYDIRDGVLEISTRQALKDHTYIEVYNVTDLLFDLTDFGAADLPAGGRGGTGGGTGGGGSGGGQGGIGDGDEEEGMTEEEMMERLVELIQKYITSPSEAWLWGDDQHEIDTLKENLIIKQTPAVHREIVSLLAKLREVRALQINVESRFLEIDTNWFEQIGFDLDLYFNTNNGMWNDMQAIDPNAQLSDFFVPGTGTVQSPIIYTTYDADGNPVWPGGLVATGNMDGTWDPDNGMVYTYGDAGTPIVQTDGFSPLGLVQGSNSLIDSIGNFNSFGTLVSGANPALGFGLQFMDDVQVDLMIEATQADQRNTILTAPRLTMHNGQRAWINISTYVEYVSGLNLSTNASAIGYTPDTARTDSGVRFEVKGVISADRRYVTMEVDFQVRDEKVSSSQTFEAATASSGDDTTGSSATVDSSISLTTTIEHRVRTTVSVPDKGTALLGGQRKVLEYETEVGVPVLSKIPYINRFFTNRTMNREEKTLVILLRPEIIIQQENEEMLFSRRILDVADGDSFLR